MLPRYGTINPGQVTWGNRPARLPGTPGVPGLLGQANPGSGATGVDLGGGAPPPSTGGDLPHYNPPQIAQPGNGPEWGNDDPRVGGAGPGLGPRPLTPGIDPGQVQFHPGQLPGQPGANMPPSGFGERPGTYGIPGRPAPGGRPQWGNALPIRGR